MSTGGMKSLERTDSAMQALADPVVLVARALMAYLFIVEGYGKIGGYSSVAGYMQDHGVPSVLLPIVILTELGGGLLILTGLATRWAAIALAGYAILTALFFHTSADQTVEFQKNLVIAGGFLVLAAYGPGASSLDGWLARARRRGASRPEQI
jgi:putative oxidoreductase